MSLEAVISLVLLEYPCVLGIVLEKIFVFNIQYQQFV